MSECIDDRYKELAAAIVANAVLDYRLALTHLKQHRALRVVSDYEQKRKEHADYIRVDCERFFRSSYFHILSELDGPRLMDRIREEVEGDNG